MAMDWVGTKPGTFINDSTLVPVNAENLNAVVDTVQKIALGANDAGINATTLQGVYKEGFATAEDVGLTNYYSFDAFDGSILLDDSIYGQHASTFNVTLGEGVEGGGGIFNGTSSYAQGGYTTGTEFTLSMFFKGTTSLANKPLLILFNTSTSYKLGLYINAGVAELRIRNTSGTINVAAGSAINDGTWHHILGTYDGVNATIYVDGIIQQSISSSLIASYYNQFRIGASEEASPVSFTAGSFDEVRIYTRYLTINEINGIFLTKNGSKSIKISQDNIASSIAMRKSDGSLEATTFNIPEDGSSTYNLKLANNSGLTADHTLTLNTNNTDRTVSLGGDISTSGALATSGSYGVTLNVTGTTSVTLPTSGTLAKVDSQAFTGTPSFPTGTTGVTQVADTNNTSLATTAFVIGQKGTATPLIPANTGSSGSSLRYASQDHVHPANFTATATDIKMDGVQSVGSLSTFPRADHVHPSDTTKANLDSPTFTGTPSLPTGTTAVTQAVNTSNTTVATTAFVNNEIANDTDYLADFRAYDATRTYGLNDPSFYNGVPYRSLVSNNLNNTPSTSPSYWEVTGGGAGVSVSPGVNFANGQFDSKQVLGWNTYADAAGTVPVDGTGGTASITFTYSSTNPLIGTGMGLLTKDAVNRQGQGVSYDFTVDLGARSKPLKIDFEYQTEGTYADGDIGCYVYDVINAIILYPSIISLPSTVGMPNHFESSLLLNQNSGSYRLIFHIQSTSASSYTMKLDNVQIQPMEPQLGAAIGEWKSYTPVISNLGSGSYTSSGMWRRVGSSLELQIIWSKDAVAGSGSSYILVSLPSGLTIDPIKTLGAQDIFGHAFSGQISPYWYSIMVGLDAGAYNTISIRASSAAITGSMVVANANVAMYVSVPISQWTSNINLATDFTEYVYNTQSAVNTNDTTSFGYGPEGTPILANTTITEYWVKFQRPVQPSDSITVEIYENGVWHLSSQRYPYNTIQDVGIRIIPQSSYLAKVLFQTYMQGTAAWSTAIVGSRWRVRKVSNGNMAEVPSTIFQPLTSVAASGASVTYTLPLAVGERKAYIPQAYLKTAGNAGTLTITTGSGTPLVIPLAASTDTITSGDALIPVYIAPDGSVVAENWGISGSNSNGTYIRYGDGTMEHWGTTISITTSTSSNATGIYFQQLSQNLPVSFINTSYIVTSSPYQSPGFGWSAHITVSSSSYISILLLSLSNTYTTSIMWHAIGRWK
jgi:hypothetical protein